MRMRLPFLLCFLVGAPQGLTAQVPTAPALAEPERVRLAESLRLLDLLGDGFWPGLEGAPEPVLLVTESTEYLVRHPRPSADFTPLGRDTLLGSTVWARPRVFPTGFLATFPAVGGIPTIVVGTALATRKSSVGWVLTLQHEHFHQWQYSRPDYYARLNALNLARGDTTGMWALEYAFPYDSAPVGEATRALALALASALAPPEGSGDATLAAVLAARDRLLGLLAPDDARYLEFQLWQEGVARWVEYAAARAAARLPEPAAAFRALPDYLPYAEQVTRGEAALRRELEGLDLARDRRVVFYPLGAAMALLLDREDGRWKTTYGVERFRLSGLLGPAQ